MTDLFILGEIRPEPWLPSDVSAHDFVRRLDKADDEVTVHISSMGGDVAEGIAIYNALPASGKRVTTVCEGMACSIASAIFMAGSVRVMRNASLLYVHDCWTMAVGDADDMRETADALDTQNELAVKAYMRGGLDAEAIRQLMREDTWIDPQAALGYGFATEVSDPPEADGVSQSARMAVFERLTGASSTLESLTLATVTVDEDAMRLIAHETAMAVVEAAGLGAAAAPEPTPEPTPEPEPQQAAALSPWERLRLAMR